MAGIQPHTVCAYEMEEGSPGAPARGRVQELEVQLREAQRASAAAHSRARELEGLAAGGAHDVAISRLSGQLLEASYERNRMQEQHAGILQREIGRLRAELQTARSANLGVPPEGGKGSRYRAAPIHACAAECILDEISAMSCLAAEVYESISQQAAREQNSQAVAGSAGTPRADVHRSEMDESLRRKIAAHEELELTCQKLMSSKASAALELEEARRQLSAAMVRNQRMQHQLSETRQIATTLFEEITILGTALSECSRGPLISAGALTVHHVKNHPTESFDAVRDGNNAVTGASYHRDPVPDNVRALVLHLDMRMSYIGEMTRFQHELQEEVAWAAEVEIGQLRVLKVETGSQHISGPRRASSEDGRSPVSFVVCSISVV
jgi:hypothetical protein